MDNTCANVSGTNDVLCTINLTQCFLLQDVPFQLCLLWQQIKHCAELSNAHAALADVCYAGGKASKVCSEMTAGLESNCCNQKKREREQTERGDCRSLGSMVSCLNLNFYLSQELFSKQHKPS